MRRAVTMALLLLVSSMSGCIQDLEDGVDKLLAPRAEVAISHLTEGDWNRDGHFGVEITHSKPVSGAIELTDRATGGVTKHSASASDAEMNPDGTYTTTVDVLIEDGEWDIRVLVNDRTWHRLSGVRIDSVPPEITGLETSGNAPDGTYELGRGASYGSDATLEILSPNGTVLGTSFPLTIEGLGDGIHIFQVVAKDQAGNRNIQLVQVIAGKATDLPSGDATFGVISRYTIQAELWDLARADDYLMPAEAQAEAPDFLGSGFGVTPDDEVVQAVVDEVVDSSMTTMEVALALYEWMFDELEYDDERLVSQTLMLPRHVIEDSEDPDAEAGSGDDEGNDGLSDDGEGNGVKGGVCRDLAGTYVSLLRAAGVPARLVTGYLAGNVNGFHAWVEVYVGELAGQDPWVPVDVSPLDGTWDEDFGATTKGPAVTMQAFGIRLPDYLPLRPLEADEEIFGWSTAIRVKYSYIEDNGVPEVEFLRDTVDTFVEEEVMCVDSVTYARQFASSPGECDFGDAVYGWDNKQDSDPTNDEATFITAAVQIIDYGVEVTRESDGSSIEVAVAYPLGDKLGDVQVEFEPYGPKGTSYQVQDSGDLAGYVTATLDY